MVTSNNQQPSLETVTPTSVITADNGNDNEHKEPTTAAPMITDSNNAGDTTSTDGPPSTASPSATATAGSDSTTSASTTDEEPKPKVIDGLPDC